MEALAMDKLIEKGEASPKLAQAIGEALDITLKAANFVTVPMLDARFAQFEAKIEARFSALEKNLESTKVWAVLLYAALFGALTLDHHWLVSRQDEFAAQINARSDARFAQEEARTDEMIAEDRAHTEQLIADDRAHTEQLIAKDRAHTEQLIAEDRARTEKLIADEQARTDRLLAQQQAHADQTTARLDNKLDQLRALILKGTRSPNSAPPPAPNP
jgi:cell division septum initiation protein DivIVA